MLPLQPSGPECVCEAATTTRSAGISSSTAARSCAVSALVIPIASSVSQASVVDPSSSTMSAASRSSWVPVLIAPSRAM
jgi:hypothetical protein